MFPETPSLKYFGGTKDKNKFLTNIISAFSTAPGIVFKKINFF
jgi:hypothetical protein